MFYAVRAGKKPGVYETWDECAVQVLAFKGAAFKKFSSRAAAESYVNPLKSLQDSAKSQSSGNILTYASNLHDTLASESKVQRVDALQTGRVLSDMRHVESEPKHTNISGFSVYMYTDGSCLSNKDVAHKVCPAGWSVVIVNGLTMEIETEIFAAVPVNRNSSFYLGAQMGSNNTAELTAIGEAFRWLINNGDSTNYPRVCIRYDSEYAAKSIQGIFNGEKNLDLIANIRRLYRQAAIGRVVVFEHVKGHSNEKFNSRADILAKKGAAGESSFTEKQGSVLKINHNQVMGGEFTNEIGYLALKKRKRDET
jgi:ribonuclease HI